MNQKHDWKNNVRLKSSSTESLTLNSKALDLTQTSGLKRIQLLNLTKAVNWKEHENARINPAAASATCN